MDTIIQIASVVGFVNVIVPMEKKNVFCFSAGGKISTSEVFYVPNSRQNERLKLTLHKLS